MSGQASAEAHDDEPPQADSASTDAWIGRVIDDRYQIERVLGEGGMGAVFVAEHLKLRKQVAFKIIRPQFAGEEAYMARFFREVMATARIENPHVARAMDCGELPGGGAFLVTELVRGRDMRAVLRPGPMSWPRACLIAVQIADALVAAHAEGIVHRDLKPENVMIDERDDGSIHARVLDFGIARVAGGDGSAAPLTRVGSVIGTPGYMAPEQAVGDSVDHRVDLYALGAILWECVVGRPLWRADSLAEIFAAQLAGDAPSLADEAASPCPPELTALVAALLERATGDRPQSAAEVRDALMLMVAASGEASSLTSGAGLAARGLAAASLASPVLHDAPTPPQPVTLPDDAGTLAIAAASIRHDPTTRRAVMLLGGLTALSLVIIAVVLAIKPEAAVAVDQGETGAPVAKEERSVLAKLVSDDDDDDDEKEATPLPARLVKSFAEMSTAKRSKERRAAAKEILDYTPAEAVPEFARLSAELELAKKCEQKREKVIALRGLKDSRALPPLRRLDGSGHSGCGTFVKRDCYECLRSELAKAIVLLEEG
ncbi:MAG: serine/threonine protein kinase [Myxococcales bacterium]|nr:serine/threonine protein kinase [Myxococcales bacterium]